MEFNDLLNSKKIDPSTVLLMRHKPTEPTLHRALPWLIAERPEIFNAFQSTQGARVEAMMTKLPYLVSFVAADNGRAIFVGLYAIESSRKIVGADAFWELPGYQLLRTLGMRGFTEEGPQNSALYFTLNLDQSFFPHWQGKLVLDWPPPGRAWVRRAHRNIMTIHAIHEESLFCEAMPHWTEIDLSWGELELLPRSWRNALGHWRGIYYVYDTDRSLGYVGSAAGNDNMLGRWSAYADSGHGGNVRLRQSRKEALRFSILQRLDPDLAIDEAIAIENSWKRRLHTREHGLNAN